MGMSRWNPSTHHLLILIMMSPAAFLAPSPSSLSLRLNPESAPGIREDLMFLRPYAVRTSPPKPS
jgi:hypothetical protein